MRRVTTTSILVFNKLKKMAIYDNESPVMEIVCREDSRKLIISGRISNLKNVPKDLAGIDYD